MIIRRVLGVQPRLGCIDSRLPKLSRQRSHTLRGFDPEAEMVQLLFHLLHRLVRIAALNLGTIMVEPTNDPRIGGGDALIKFHCAGAAA